MAEPVLLLDGAVWLGGYDLSAQLDTINFTVGRGELDHRPFGDVLETKYPGVLTPELSVKGFWNSTDDGILAARVPGGDRTSWPITLAPPNGIAGSATPAQDGGLAYSIIGAQFMYDGLSGKFGELLPYTLKTLPRSSGGCYRQTVILPKASRTVTTTGVGQQLGAVSATQKLCTVLHVFTVVGGSWVVTIESDDNAPFGTPTVRQTFTAVTAITRQVIETAGPITDDRFRAVLTKTGGTSCVAAVTTSIENIGG